MISKPDRRDRGGESRLAHLFQAQFAIVLSDDPLTFAGGVFKLLAVHDLHYATRVFDEFLLCRIPAAELTVGLSVPSMVARKS